MRKRERPNTAALIRRDQHKQARKLANDFARLVRLGKLTLPWGETARGRCVACGTGVDHPNRGVGVWRFFFVHFVPQVRGGKLGHIHMTDPFCALCALRIDERYRP